ncbi:MAG: glutaredoxin [Candidatus Paceibacter sp.]|jgi:glutaredoxin-like YruB-family protein|nr:glutaredoxin [Candidatus Paceibacter sp.]
MKSVTLYSTQTCKYCKHAEAFFKEHNIAYEKVDVGIDAEKRNEMVEKSGQMGVPVMDIGGDIVIGYDEDALRELLLNETPESQKLAA